MRKGIFSEGQQRTSGLGTSASLALGESAGKGGVGEEGRSPIKPAQPAGREAVDAARGNRIRLERVQQICWLAGGRKGGKRDSSKPRGRILADGP